MTQRYFEHVTTSGERWDLIAWRYYRAVWRQTTIIAANRHLFLDPAAPDGTGSRQLGRVPAVLPGGLVIRIPVIEERIDESFLPPWKRGMPAEPLLSGPPLSFASGSLAGAPGSPSATPA